MLNPSLPPEKQFYTVKELVAAGYGSRTTIWREIKRGNLPAVKTETGRVLIPRDLFVIYQHNHLVTPLSASERG